MATTSKQIQVTLRGIRPIMFDRYAGDNKTKLEPLDRLYLNANGHCILPMLNLYSLLSAQNTPSVAKRFYGKQARDVALGIQAFVGITGDDSDGMAAIIRDDKGQPYTQDDERIKVLEHVARLDKGIPNPKKRPIIPQGWNIALTFDYITNEHVSEGTLRAMMEQGGVIGLGTFRPIYGRYVCDWKG